MGRQKGELKKGRHWDDDDDDFEADFRDFNDEAEEDEFDGGETEADEFDAVHFGFGSKAPFTRGNWERNFKKEVVFLLSRCYVL